MKERPILFSAPMVRAILEGRKTQTRRVLKHQPIRCTEMPVLLFPQTKDEAIEQTGYIWPNAKDQIALLCPYGKPGDQLWVRETWRTDKSMDNIAPRSFSAWPVRYEADGAYLRHGAFYGATDGKTRVSIHMPRWASRISLEITGVRVERLQDISEADCWSEGIESCDGLLDDMQIIALAKQMGLCVEDAKPTYAALWESINGAGSWEANPWVWVVEFKRVSA